MVIDKSVRYKVVLTLVSTEAGDTGRRTGWAVRTGRLSV